MAPLVYLSPRASRQAAKLLPGRIAKNEIANAILRGAVAGGQPPPVRVVCHAAGD